MRLLNESANLKPVKRKRGRPRLPVHIEYKSISVPKELWNELFIEAQTIGSSVGRVASNRLRHSEYVPDDDPAVESPDDGVDF